MAHSPLPPPPSLLTVGEQEIYISNWEHKNEMVDITSEPLRENEASFVHLQHGKSGRNPMLLVNVVGPHHIQVFGAT